MRYVTALALTCGLLGAHTVASVQNWGQTPVSSWTPKQVTAFLNDSPWAGKASIRRVTSHHFKKHTAVIIWESAPLVRQARARSGLPSVHLAAPDATTYTVSLRIWGTSATLRGFVLRLPQVTLRVAGGAPLVATRVETNFVDKSGQPIALLPAGGRGDFDGQVNYDACGSFVRRQSPSPHAGMPFPTNSHVDSSTRFDLPREGPLPCDKAAVHVFEFDAATPFGPNEIVEFAMTIGFTESGTSFSERISRTFEMRRMMVNGALELR